MGGGVDQSFYALPSAHLQFTLPVHRHITRNIPSFDSPSMDGDTTQHWITSGYSNNDPCLEKLFVSDPIINLLNNVNKLSVFKIRLFTYVLNSHYFLKRSLLNVSFIITACSSILPPNFYLYGPVVGYQSSNSKALAWLAKRHQQLELLQCVLQ